jgi:SAM-dependent methyltransferase
MISISDYGTGNETARESWIRDRLQEIPAGSKILDAGAGDQHHKKDCEHLAYTSQDIAEYDGKGNGKGLQTGAYDFGKIDIISDITSIPREDYSFDAILCSEVLEHVVYPDLVIKELSRLLRVGGKLILTAPFCSLTHFAPNHYTTGFNIYWYQKVLPQNNLKADVVVVYGNYFEYLAQELHRLPQVAQIYCQSPVLSEKDTQSIVNVVSLLERFGTSPNNRSWELLNFGGLIVAEKEMNVQQPTGINLSPNL